MTRDTDCLPIRCCDNYSIGLVFHICCTAVIYVYLDGTPLRWFADTAQSAAIDNLTIPCIYYCCIDDIHLLHYI